MGKNGEYLENPRRQNILRTLLGRADTQQHCFCKVVALVQVCLWVSLGFLRIDA